MKIHALRKDEAGGIGLYTVLIVLVVAFIMVAAFLIIGPALSPYRQMNAPPEGEECLAYARASGTFAISAVFGELDGEFHSTEVDLISDPNDHGASGAFPSASAFGKKGSAWATVSVRGPDGMEVVAWETPKVHFDIPLLDQFNPLNIIIDPSDEGTFESGAACFWEHGESVWNFALIFEDEGSGVRDTLDTDVVALEV